MMKVLHNSYTMCTRGSPDIYTLSPRASGVYIRQTTRAHGITIKCAGENCNKLQDICQIHQNIILLIFEPYGGGILNGGFTIQGLELLKSKAYNSGKEKTLALFLGSTVMCMWVY